MVCAEEDNSGNKFIMQNKQQNFVVFVAMGKKPYPLGTKALIVLCQFEL